jgi:hypothetical protein
LGGGDGVGNAGGRNRSDGVALSFTKLQDKSRVQLLVDTGKHVT